LYAERPGATTYNATATAVITEPDYAAQGQAAARNAANARRFREQREILFENSLRANTLWPNQHAGGDLYFKRSKFKKGALIVTIGSIDYFFVIFRNYHQ
jgi:hypothetical protein